MRVHGTRARCHDVEREGRRLHARGACEARGGRGVRDQRGDRVAERRRITDCHQETRLAFAHHFRNASSERGCHRFTEHHRVEKYRAHAFLPRAPGDDGGRGQKIIGIISIAKKVQTAGEARLDDRTLHCGPERSVAHKQRVQIRYPPPRRRDRVHECQRIFVPHQLRDLHHQRRLGRHTKLGELLAAGRRWNAGHVGAVRNNDHRCGEACARDDISDGL